MIKAHCFTKEWINGFKQQKHFKRINPPVLEKMIQALSLLQQLKAQRNFFCVFRFIKQATNIKKLLYDFLFFVLTIKDSNGIWCKCREFIS